MVRLNRLPLLRHPSNTRAKSGGRTSLILTPKPGMSRKCPPSCKLSQACIEPPLGLKISRQTCHHCTFYVLIGDSSSTNRSPQFQHYWLLAIFHPCSPVYSLPLQCRRSVTLATFSNLCRIGASYLDEIERAGTLRRRTQPSSLVA